MSKKSVSLCYTIYGSIYQASAEPHVPAFPKKSLCFFGVVRCHLPANLTLQALEHTLLLLNGSLSATFPRCGPQKQGALRSLRAGQCAGLRCLTLQLPAAHPLRSLHLAGCSNLAEVTIAAAGLESLHVGACASLHRLDLHCASLR